jgi:HSP20 family protein
METRALLPSFGRRGLFAPLANLREEMDKLFNEWVKDVDFEPLRMFEGEGGFTYMPRLNVVERENVLEITAELPGVEAKDLTLELTKSAVLLRGEKKFEEEVKKEGYLRYERRFGSFLREIPLPWEVDVAKTNVKTVFENGILTVKVPKPKDVLAATKKIEIA